jgi:hypothetical protein
MDDFSLLMSFLQVIGTQLVALSLFVVSIRNLLSGTGYLARRFNQWFLRDMFENLSGIHADVNENMTHIMQNRRDICELTMLNHQIPVADRARAAGVTMNEGWNGHMKTLAEQTLEEYRKHLADQSQQTKRSFLG